MKPIIEARKVGLLEIVRIRKPTRFVESWAVFVDGRECLPMLRKRDALKIAKEWRADLDKGLGRQS